MMANHGSYDSPTVSVILPVHNGELYLSESIDSVLEQSFQHLELIVVNDGSTDRSASILESYADSRIKIVHLAKRSGVAHARNAGAALAQGRYIAWLDADDVWFTHKLTVQAAILDEHSNLVCIGGPFYAMSSTGSVVGRVGMMGRFLTQTRLREGQMMPFPLSSTLMRASSLDTIGAFRPSFDRIPGQIEDLDLMRRLSQQGEVEWLPMILGSYRLHPGSVSARSFRQQQYSAAKYRQGQSNSDSRENSNWNKSWRFSIAQRNLRRALELRASGSVWHAGLRIALSVLLARTYTVRKLPEFFV